MPPKPRQLRAPRPKQPGNAFQALVDLPEDGSESTFDGRDGIVDGTDDNTVVIANPRDSGPPASQQLQHNEWVEDNIVVLSQQINDLHYKNETRLYNIEERVSGLSNSQQHMATATPPLRLQQPAPKPSIFPSDSDSQHSFTYLCEFPESSTLISLIFVAKSEFSPVLAHPATRNATKTSPTPRPTTQTIWERIPNPCGPS
jgi:hypothetical protein